MTTSFEYLKKNIIVYTLFCVKQLKKKTRRHKNLSFNRLPSLSFLTQHRFSVSSEKLKTKFSMGGVNKKKLVFSSLRYS